MATQDAFHGNTHLRAHVVTLPPIDTRTLAHRFHQFRRNDAELVIAHDLYSAFILGKRVIEASLCLAQIICGFCLKILRQRDEFLENLERVDAPVVVSGNCIVQAFRELLILNDIAPCPSLDLTVLVLLQRLDIQVFLFKVLDLDQKFF